jgi:hypothetical protein
MLFDKIDDLGSACSDCADFRLDPINALIRIHMQLGDEPTSYEAYSHFWHPVLLRIDGFTGRSVSVTALTNLRRRSKMKIRYVTIHIEISTFDRAETNRAHVF